MAHCFSCSGLHAEDIIFSTELSLLWLRSQRLAGVGALGRRAACGFVEVSLFVVWLGAGGRFLYDMGGSRVWNINGTSKCQSCELAARLLLRPQNRIK